MNLLHVDASILADQSTSRQLTREIVARWAATHPGTQVDRLDLALEAPSHLSADSLGFRAPAGATLTETQQRENAVSENLVSRFLAADVIVVGAPLYNFSIPSQLKAWIDRIAQPGRTFRYTEQGPVGLAAGKTVIVASTRGGIYSTSAAGEAMEHQESYLRTVFGFFGITDVRVVRAEGLAMGADAQQAALAAARQAITTLAGASAAANEERQTAAA
jgi:FMN-dependent NADH-azoreductase